MRLKIKAEIEVDTDIARERFQELNEDIRGLSDEEIVEKTLQMGTYYGIFYQDHEIER